MNENPAEIVTKFLRAFTSGEVEAARQMTTDDFSFQAPLWEGRGDKRAYFAGAEKKAEYVRTFRILRQWQDGDEVATIYELDIRTPKGRAVLPISEWHTVRDGRVASTWMLFNRSASGVELLREALLTQR
jgi:predicted SnoaL-like aldol condensation-catalyzing enzyme